MPQVSVIIPSRNPRPDWMGALFNSLLAQTLSDFEVIVVDDASDGAAYALPEDSRFRLVSRPRRSGPAACRNAGAAEARAECLFFTDTDCVLGPDTLSRAVKELALAPVSTGNTITRVETPFGRLVALLGFPGGGILGFDRVWRVDPAGFAQSFSSCNVAVRRDFFAEMGGFDETFPVAGGEDTVLARRILEAGHKIRYQAAQEVFHVEKPDLRGFIRWQIVRGRGNFHIHRRVPKVGGYLRLRLWTFRNSLKAAGLRAAPAVLALIVLSVLLQLWGYWRERRVWEQA